LIPRYLSDREVAAVFARADVAVFPYLRAAQSGAVRVAMAHGMPVVASDVGGLSESCREYAGALLTPPSEPDALAQAMIKARELVGRQFSDPFTWERSIDAYDAVFEAVRGPASGTARSQPSPR
jgi:glycosyltransferase involved in cell wall biosynthesis